MIILVGLVVVMVGGFAWLVLFCWILRSATVWWGSGCEMILDNSDWFKLFRSSAARADLGLAMLRGEKAGW